MPLLDAFGAELVGLATPSGLRRIERRELYAFCRLRGETHAEAEASAFGPWTRPLKGDEPGLLDAPPIRAAEAAGMLLEDMAHAPA